MTQMSHSSGHLAIRPANIVSISKSTNLVLLVLIAFQTSMDVPHLQQESLRSSRGVQGSVCKTAGATENHG